jgi:hypothetical protein
MEASCFQESEALQVLDSAFSNEPGVVPSEKDFLESDSIDGQRTPIAKTANATSKRIFVLDSSPYGIAAKGPKSSSVTKKKGTTIVC